MIKASSVNAALVAVNSVKSHAMGPDGICPRFLKIILPFIVAALTHILNSCVTMSSFPKLWKIARVVPIPKVKKTVSVSDFRPISINSFLAKVLEKLICFQMKTYLEENQLLCPLQSGFRSGHSTTTAILKITEDIREGIDNECLTVLTLLDFTKAFDSVNHHLLINKLNSFYNFSGDALRFFASYLTERLQRVEIDGRCSSLLRVSSGVPQGSLLGPFLFSMFINDIHRVLKHCQIHMYADDVQLYISRPLGLIEDAISRLNEDLLAVNSWSARNQLILNPAKCNSIVIYKENIDTSAFPGIILGNNHIPYVCIVKSLGMVINKVFSWSDHVNYVVRKVYGGLRRLWVTAHLIPLSTRLKLIQALIVPIISFGDVIYAGLDSANKRKLNVAFNACTRYVYRLRRFDHVSPYSSSILSMPLDVYFNYRICLFIRNLLRGRTPHYLFEKLQLMSSERSGNLIIPRYSSLVTSRSFFVHGVRTYNQLPVEIKRVGSVGGFKKHLQYHFSGM